MQLIVAVSAGESEAGTEFLAGSAGEEVGEVRLGDGMLRVSGMEDLVSLLGNLRGGREFNLMMMMMTMGRSPVAGWLILGVWCLLGC